ncbi:MAG: hypothetical protein R2861_13110 [Desulfobacterales bacterium]
MVKHRWAIWRISACSPPASHCHCVVLAENDISLLAEKDVKVSHNPASNMKLAWVSRRCRI